MDANIDFLKWTKYNLPPNDSTSRFRHLTRLISIVSKPIKIMVVVIVVVVVFVKKH